MNAANSPDREPRRARLHRRDPDDDRERDRRDQLHDRRARRGRGDLLHQVTAHAVRLLVEAAFLVVLAAEELHHLVPADRLLDHLRDVAHRLLHLAAGGAQPHAEHAHDEHDQRRHREREQRELPVEPQQVGEQADDRERVLEHDGEHAGRRRGDLGHVEGELGDESAGGLLGRSRTRAARGASRTSRCAGPSRGGCRPSPSRSWRDRSRARARRTAPTMTTGIQRITSGSLSMKVPSISGFISAGSTGSVAATTTMPAMPSANTRQYGLTCASSRRYSAVLVMVQRTIHAKRRSVIT